MLPRFPLSLFSLAGLSALLAACGRPEGGNAVITETREVSDYEPKPVKLSALERFGDLPFRFKTPETWKHLPPAPMRQLNFAFGPAGEGECYLTVSPQAMGGVADNINRWRGQMGLEPAPVNDIAKLPLRDFLGGKGFYIDLTGNYTGAMPMSMNAAPEAPETKSDYRMLTLYMPSSEFTIIVKMVGPAALVAAEEQNFLSFCDSFRFRNSN